MGEPGGQDDGGGRGLGLAQRFRAALDQRLDSRNKQLRAQQEREERARAARRALMRDLEAFGLALGHADVTANEGLVAIRLGERSLRFQVADAVDRVDVQGDGLRDGWRLEFNDELRAWGLFPPHGAVRPLFDKGLEELLARVFSVRPVAPGSEAVTAGDETSPAPRKPGKRTL